MQIYLIEEGTVIDQATADTKEAEELHDKAEIMQNQGYHVYIGYEKREV